MGRSWAGHGQTMGQPWAGHGQTMGKPCANHWQTMGKPWATMDRLWAWAEMGMGRFCPRKKNGNSNFYKTKII